MKSKKIFMLAFIVTLAISFSGCGHGVESEQGINETSISLSNDNTQASTVLNDTTITEKETSTDIYTQVTTINYTVETGETEQNYYPTEMLIFRQNEDLEDFFSLESLADEQIENNDSKWNALYYLDGNRYHLLESFMQELKVPEHVFLRIQSLVIRPDTNISAEWGANVLFSDGLAYIALLLSKTNPIDDLQAAAERNQIQLHSMENGNMECLYFCEQQMNGSLIMYYGVVDDFFICVSFARTDKDICDQIMNNIEFISFKTEVFE